MSGTPLLGRATLQRLPAARVDARAHRHRAAPRLERVAAELIHRESTWPAQ